MKCPLSTLEVQAFSTNAFCSLQALCYNIFVSFITVWLHFSLVVSSSVVVSGRLNTLL